MTHNIPIGWMGYLKSQETGCYWDSLKTLYKSRNIRLLEDAFSWDCSPQGSGYWWDRCEGTTRMSKEDWLFVELLYKIQIQKKSLEAVLLEYLPSGEFEESLWV